MDAARAIEILSEAYTGEIDQFNGKFELEAEGVIVLELHPFRLIYYVSNGFHKVYVRDEDIEATGIYRGYRFFFTAIHVVSTLNTLFKHEKGSSS